jgi:hypothetical protein
VYPATASNAARIISSVVFISVIKSRLAHSTWNPPTLKLQCVCEVLTYTKALAGETLSAMNGKAVSHFGSWLPEK